MSVLAHWIQTTLLGASIVVQLSSTCQIVSHPEAPDEHFAKAFWGCSWCHCDWSSCSECTLCRSGRRLLRCDAVVLHNSQFAFCGCANVFVRLCTPQPPCHMQLQCCNNTQPTTSKDGLGRDPSIYCIALWHFAIKQAHCKQSCSLQEHIIHLFISPHSAAMATWHKFLHMTALWHSCHHVDMLSEMLSTILAGLRKPTGFVRL